MTDSDTEFTGTEMHEALIQLQRRYVKHARDCRRAGHLERAGAYYVARAMGDQMRLRPRPEQTATTDSLAADPTAFGYAVKYLFAGGLCYRLADVPEQCRRYAQQGENVAAGLLYENAFDGARKGLLHEVQGDFRVLGNLGNYEFAYNRAAEQYSEAGNDLGWQMEDDFDAASQLVVELAQSADYGLNEATKEKITRHSLTARIDYKREEFANILDAVIMDGNWTSKTL